MLSWNFYHRFIASFVNANWMVIGMIFLGTFTFVNTNWMAIGMILDFFLGTFTIAFLVILVGESS